MRHTFMVALALIGFLLRGSADAHKDEARRLIVKITSSDVSIPLTFSGAYVFFDGELEVLEATTPHVLVAKSHIFSGIFQQQSPDAVLEVRLFENTGDQERELAMGDGNVVVINEHGKGRWVSSW